MRHWLICLMLLCGVSGCATITPWRQRNPLAQIDRIFSECAAKRSSSGTSNWTETVRCGNDGARLVIAESSSPYASLIEAALASRLAIAQQIDGGALSAGEGQAKLATLDAQIQSLPGSMMDLLSMTIGTNPR